MGTLPPTDHVEAISDFDTIPAGRYIGEITSTEQVNTSKGDPMLKVEFTILEGEYEGRKVFDQFMLDHDNPKAVEIGLRKLKQIKLAIGKPDAEEESELWNEPLVAKVTIEKDKTGQYDDKNRIGKYEPIRDGEEKQSKPAAKAAPARQAPPAKAAPAPAKASASAGRSWGNRGKTAAPVDEDDIPF